MVDRRGTRPRDRSRGGSKCTRKTGGTLVALVITGALLGGVESAAAGSSQWTFAGGNLQNTRWQASEKTLSVSNVAGLEQQWAFTTGGDVSATPAVDGDTVYFPDRAGNLYAVDKATGQQRWRSSIGAASGVPGDYARATPALAGNKPSSTQLPLGLLRWLLHQTTPRSSGAGMPL
jgi:polyvinyl alcohol dehydrogenase (cytochrome)